MQALTNSTVCLQNVEKHRIPIFSEVIISTSGIESKRRAVIKISQGGKYVKKLKRPIKVTHLLCGDENTENVRTAEKFNECGEADICIVWEEWFWDSLSFKARLAEERYLVGVETGHN
jgi:hypothetical protein